jgi:hypothetical protein
LLYPLIQRFHDARVDGGNDIYGGIQFFLGQSRFPCVRKAPGCSRLAVARHRDGKPDKNSLSLIYRNDAMRITVKFAKVGLFHVPYWDFLA